VTIRLLIAGLVATGASAAVSVLIVKSQSWHGKHTLDHDLEGVQKFHTAAVPRIGGVSVIAAIFLSLLLCDYIALGLLPRAHVESGILLLIAGLPTFIAGITEDLTKKVSVKARLVASIASALLASWLLGATVDALDIWGVDSLLTWMPFALLVTAITVSGGVNAINIIDGFNGLAASTVLVMLAALGAVGWQVGDYLVVELAVLGIGAVCGFLMVNYPKGRLFLGDGGAYFLGFWVAEIVVLLLVRNTSINAWQVLSICGYPIIEVLYSIHRRRFVRQVSPGAPDGLHLHTLVYRRVVPKFLPHNASQPWKRNAAVTFVIMPWVVASSVLSVWAGRTVGGAMGIVVIQLVVYIAIYTRLVRGRWGGRNAPALSEGKDVKIEVQ
jgi:UDP-N-acetylmuramyl pentapeptide phosphotransferase/UDP-N-acetylglucosamine-1-phosphate transferase